MEGGAVLGMTPEATATFMQEGRAMCAKFNSLVQSIAKRATAITLQGHQGLMVNTTSEFASDVGAVLSARSGTFALMWSIDAKGQLKASLRSQPGFDVRVIAEAFGGGGHPQAAAMLLGTEHLIDLIQGTLWAR